MSSNKSCSSSYDEESSCEDYDEEGVVVVESRVTPKQLSTDDGSRVENQYIDEAMFALLQQRREEALSQISDYNPFVNCSKSSLYGKVKLVIGGCTLLPLRCLGLGPLLLSLYALTSLSIAGLSDEKLKEKPLTSWRKGILHPTVKYGSRALLFLLGYQWVRTRGQASAEAPIVISNHPSWFEHLWLLYMYVPSAVGKEDVKKVPLYGRYAKAIQTIFVKRSSPESRKEAAQEIYDRVTTRYDKLKARRHREGQASEEREEQDTLQRSKQRSKKSRKAKHSQTQVEDDNELMKEEADGVGTSHGASAGEDGVDNSEQRSGKKEKKKKAKKERKASSTESGVWPPLFVFPEGGNSSAQGFISFKLGAFNPGVPIQPVLFTLPYKHLDVSPAPGTNKLGLLVKTLCQFHNKMNVTYLPVYYPSEEEQNDPKLYARNVRQLMADELSTAGIQATEHAYEDVILLHHAKRRRYPHRNILLEARKLLDHFEILELNKNTLTRSLDKFIEMDTNRSGEVSFSEFCSVLHLPEADVTRRLFAFFDTDSSGHIDFREYVTGVATLWKVLTTRALNDTFALFAGNEAGAESFTLTHAKSTLKQLFACLTEEQIEGIIARVCKHHKSDIVTRGEFEELVKDYPEYIHLLLTVGQLATAAAGLGGVEATALGEGKGKEKALEREIPIESDKSCSSSTSADEHSDSNSDEGELQALNRSDMSSSTKKQQKKQKKQKEAKKSPTKRDKKETKRVREKNESGAAS